MLAKLEERIAELRISTNVTGADIRVDGVSVGHRPFSGSSRQRGNAQGQRVQDRAPEAVRTVTVAGRESVKVELQIDESIVTSAARAPGAVSSSVPLIERTQPQAVSLIKTTQPPVTPGRTGLIVSLSTTAVLGVGTGVFGYLALNAQKDLKNQISTYPNTRDNIENARTRSKNYGTSPMLSAPPLLSQAGWLSISCSPTAAFRQNQSPE